MRLVGEARALYKDLVGPGVLGPGPDDPFWDPSQDRIASEMGQKRVIFGQKGSKKGSIFEPLFWGSWPEPQILIEDMSGFGPKGPRTPKKGVQKGVQKPLF